ncbi:MAG: hypothetical protein OXI24_07560 [Candidatus Poribacteria bacterium]|nr:hypothetical protein [Candidatus Poribacteria bacterium]
MPARIVGVFASKPTKSKLVVAQGARGIVTMPEDREMSAEDQFLFETYKLHAELAERVASLREGLNKLYSSMVASIVAASVLLHRFLPDTKSVWIVAVLGILLSLSWTFSLLSITGRLSAKHKVLLELEEQLPFKFLRKENLAFNQGSFLRRKYSALVMPSGFLMVSTIWFAILLIRDYCS